MTKLIKEAVTSKSCKAIELIRQSFHGLNEGEFMFIMQAGLDLAPEQFLGWQLVISGGDLI
jgi:hypothetical protein